MFFAARSIFFRVKFNNMIITSSIFDQQQAFIYDIAKQKGKYLENSAYDKIIMVAGYQNQDNYFAYTKKDNSFFLIQWQDGKVKHQIDAPTKLDKMCVYQDNIVFSSDHTLYMTNFSNGNYVALTESETKVYSDEDWYVYENTLLYPANYEIKTSECDLYSFSFENNQSTFVLRTSASILGLISANEIILREIIKEPNVTTLIEPNGTTVIRSYVTRVIELYVFDFVSQDKHPLPALAKTHPPSCISSLNYAVVHTSAGASTSKVVLIDLKKNKRYNLIGYPLNCIGSGAYNIELVTIH